MPIWPDKRIVKGHGIAFINRLDNTPNRNDKEMKNPKWEILELRRFDRLLLQISKYDTELGKYEIIGTVTLHESDMESRNEWQRAIEMMNKESSQKIL